MLSVALVSSRQGCNYYSQDTYYTKEHAIENSEWQGIGAEHLGLSDYVNSQDFQRLLEGKFPNKDISINSYKNTIVGERRAGLDLTFSAPKSVSLASLVGGDKQLEIAHREAVVAALKVAEERYSLTRTGGNKDRKNELSGNFIVAKFHHNTSRAKDPQLHTHCVVINAVKRHDNQWRSLHNEEIFSNSKLIGLVYQNELAARTKALGYNIERKNNGTFELAGYSENQLHAFSKRREQIEKLGAKNQKEARALVLKNRPAKGHELPESKLSARWQREAEALAIRHPIAQVNSKSVATKFHLDYAEIVQAGAQHATQKEVSFKREKLESFALSANLGNINWKQLGDEFSRAEKYGDIIACKRNAFTTKQAIEVEQHILQALSNGRNKSIPICTQTPKIIEDNSWSLNAGQKTAVTNLLTSKNQFIAWQGVAGAGKTYALNAFREIAEKEKISITGFAPSAQAAHVLEKESKIPSTTVASLMMSYALGIKLDKNDVLIIDEASLLSAKQCAQLMQFSERDRSRILFVGDVRQLSGVEAGNPFKLMQQNGIEVSHLSESQRQKNAALKASVALMAAQKEREALEGIKASIVERKSEHERAKFITQEYQKLEPKERAETLVLAGTNHERAMLTREIRSSLKNNKDLKESGIIVSTLKARDLTRQEIADAANINIGDVLVFHKAVKSINVEKGSTYQIDNIKINQGIISANNSEGHAISFSTKKFVDRYTLYERKEIEICEGEKLRITRNNKSLGVRNGEDFTVANVNPNKLNLCAKGGKTLELDTGKFLHVDHNYVNTVYSSQGKTCNQAIISVDNTFGREAMYVAMSRAKYGVQIVTENTKEMAQIVSESRAKVSALEVVKEIQISKDLSQELSRGQRHSRGRSM